MSGTGRAVRGSPASAASSAAANGQHVGVAAARADDLQAERHAVAVAPDRQRHARDGRPASRHRPARASGNRCASACRRSRPGYSSRQGRGLMVIDGRQDDVVVARRTPASAGTARSAATCARATSAARVTQPLLDIGAHIGADILGPVCAPSRDARRGSRARAAPRTPRRRRRSPASASSALREDVAEQAGLLGEHLARCAARSARSRNPA